MWPDCGYRGENNAVIRRASLAIPRISARGSASLRQDKTHTKIKIKNKIKGARGWGWVCVCVCVGGGIGRVGGNWEEYGSLSHACKREIRRELILSTEHQGGNR